PQKTQSPEHRRSCPDALVGGTFVESQEDIALLFPPLAEQRLGERKLSGDPSARRGGGPGEAFTQDGMEAPKGPPCPGDEELRSPALSGLEASGDQTEEIIAASCPSFLQAVCELPVDRPGPESRASGPYGLTIKRMSQTDRQPLPVPVDNCHPPPLGSLEGGGREELLQQAC